MPIATALDAAAGLIEEGIIAPGDVPRTVAKLTGKAKHIRVEDEAGKDLLAADEDGGIPF